MKIAYLVLENISRESGVHKKIYTQIKEWIGQGNIVKLFGFTRTGQVWDPLKIGQIEACKVCNIWQAVLKANKLANSILKWKPDIIYMRLFSYHPAWELFFGKFPIIIEINTDDIKEYKQWPLWKYSYHLITVNRLLTKASGFICVTNELKFRVNKYKSPILVLSNGFDLSEVTPAMAPLNERPRLVFIGFPGFKWHGLDKILKLAKIEKNWDFDIIGYGFNDICNNIPPNVFLHGYLSRIKYDNILRSADVAIGSLALHRKDMHEGCALKVREYLAYGIPTIIAYDDTDLQCDVSWLLRIPNVENNVENSINEIESFVHRVWRYKIRVPRDEIMFLDSKVKESIRLKFLQKILKCFYLN